jgi:hypothetical protein
MHRPADVALVRTPNVFTVFQGARTDQKIIQNHYFRTVNHEYELSILDLWGCYGQIAFERFWRGPALAFGPRFLLLSSVPVELSQYYLDSYCVFLSGRLFAIGERYGKRKESNI